MNSYRIKTEIGKDKSVKVQIDQDFEFLEILSLKLLQSEIYTRPCADYGVIIGRVSINNGFGLPNCKVSIFIPLSSEDELNPLISELYPYRSLNDINEDGYRYNLLPYEKSYSSHSPTGTFFSREDVLINQTLIEVYDKYYKLNAITNESGDFMIFGVPLGPQTIHFDIDLSDIGEFSLTPQDLVRIGLATEQQVSGTRFQTSSNLNSLPQIVTINKIIQVDPFWGEENICNLGITRVDFDLSSELNIRIEPIATFMGSLITTNDDYFLKKNCKPRNKLGDLCQLNVGPGEILAIRHTINTDEKGRPILEQYVLDESGQVIDEDGTWLVDLPMNLDYVITNEFGERVLSTDPTKGIPTKAKYRFKIKYNQSPTLSESNKRGYFLVPNVKEWGWNSSDDDPYNDSGLLTDSLYNSYAFSLDWKDYGTEGTPIGDRMIQEAIDCEDRFYPMMYNKVYTISQMIDFFRYGYNPQKGTIIKNILDSECESDTNKFPTNDAFQRFDFIYVLFSILLFIIKPILYAVLAVVHVVVWVLNNLIPGNKAKEAAAKLAYIPIPNFTYPDCEFCSCETPQSVAASIEEPEVQEPPETTLEGSFLSLTTRVTHFESDTYEINVPIQSIFAGASSRAPGVYTLNPPNVRVFGTEQVQSISSDGVFFTTSLPLCERINLFNTKAKYFDEDLINNPGGGWNRIKVSFNYPQNLGLFHYDNTIVVLCRTSNLADLTQGTILSFQDPQGSKDVNINQAPLNNYGVTSITGEPINLGNNVQVKWAHPNGQQVSSTTYYITGSTEDALYAKFGMDMEYFQVVTAMTVSDFGLQQGGEPNSFYQRYLFNNTKFYKYNAYIQNFIPFGEIIDLSQSQPFIPINGLLDPDEGYSGEEQIVLILVRGVDPYSTRTPIRYDLSRIFGYNNWGQVVVEGDFKLNIPIQGSEIVPFGGGGNYFTMKSASHDIFNNGVADANGLRIYFPSYHFLPDQVGFSGFTSKYPYLYSSLGDNTSDFTPTDINPGSIVPPDLNEFTDTSNSSQTTRVIIDGNLFLKEWSNTTNPFQLNLLSSNFNNSNTNSCRNYLENEIVDGASVMYMTTSDFTTQQVTTFDSFYYAPSYTTTLDQNEEFAFGVYQNIVMRSDRLPTSNTQTLVGNNSYPLQTNQLFSAYIIPDEGIVPVIGFEQTPNFNGVSENQLNEPGEQPSFTNEVLQSFECGSNMAPLRCYYTSQGACGSEIKIYPKSNSCWTNGYVNDKCGSSIIFNNGCYIFVRKGNPFRCLSNDIELLNEWMGRLQINFAACRNIWSHIFTNNWINGTLFAYPIKNQRRFTSPTSSNPNQPFSVYCTKTIILHPTNNFYYRSSPYKFDPNNESNSGFIGADRVSTFISGIIDYGGNSKNLKTPTTIMDMGPRVDFLQEIIFSDDYDGYIMNKMKSTSFSDVSEILNLLILSRLINIEFIKFMKGAGGIKRFFSRDIKRVDADYAQMISINSEIGVQSFETENYPDNPGCEQDPIFFNGADSAEAIMGIFFSSDTQLRDFITPKRTIISPNVPVTQPCAFSYFNSFSQEVPFYQWNIKEGDPDSIFGDQKNEWFTAPLIDSTFYLSRRYQHLDRINPNDRYFRTNNLSQTRFFKGYIFSVDQDGKLSAQISTWDINYGNYQRSITVGAPFHFYFGLRSGKSAFDRFAKKYLDFEKTIEASE